ncbi:MAG: flavin reductase [Gemmatimonadetes bacterium]|jgi:flavin reductase (DIM6/NTAB) family NADH-FMN oxidoreductase RutF|nr:flavin reductase [Gemmatimonadota bacterium]MBT5057587.1 flavin reductase [Gemmatimonadota bacterium]MBT5142678.1 flavin reductase [Gemmatimonadota bacterium]MBT5587654.1 flavin reductase [Gemmatimonadota bacterium]MBT5960576.1 flavin reductase [Gemmatimonadota bacterium]
MDTLEKNRAIQMLQSGVYVLTAQAEEDKAVATVVSWVTQASFSPPLVVVALRVGSRIHGIVQQACAFTINILDRQHTGVARSFFEPVWEKSGTLAGQRFDNGSSGAPVLECATGYLECSLDLCLEKGDHSIFVGQVVDAGIHGSIEGRPDEVSLQLRDFGVYYGG